MSINSNANKPVNTDCIIIGAGLSGLTAAWYVKKRTGKTPLILEARDRIGGRIHTSASVDLGATWLGSDHQNLVHLLNELHIETFPQYQQNRGIFIHSAAEPPHYFNAGENGSSTLRIAGGSGRLIDMLAKKSGATITTGCEVFKIEDKGDFIALATNKQNFKAKQVVLTVPLQLADQTIQFNPSLPKSVSNAMESTHTWMSNAIKVGLTFTSPFWRKHNLSGTLVAPNSPVIELYDHCNRGGNTFSLMGFANEGLREQPSEKRKKMITDFLATHFGDNINDYLSYTEKDWLDEKFTATKLSKSIYMHPNYGSDIWEKPYMQDKLLFSGSETSSIFGGYMEGAVASGMKAAEFIIRS